MCRRRRWRPRLTDMLRRVLILVAVLAGAALCSWPAMAAASDPPAKKAADPHADKKAATETHAPKMATAQPHTKKPSADSPAAKKAAKASASPEDAPLPLATDLQAVNDRIQERLAEVRKTQTAKSSSRAKVTASRREAPAARPAAPRVELVWRPSVSWPQELQSGATTAAAPSPLVSERVAVTWGPQP